MIDTTTHGVFDIFDEICRTMAKAEDERIFREKKEDGTINGDFVLLMNPKYKGQLCELRAAGLMIPVVWSPLVEEDKSYVITDKEMVNNFKACMPHLQKGV